MDNIKNFYQNFGFIIAFMVLTLFISMTFGQKVTNVFLTLVLLSMITVNADKFNTVISKFFKSK